MKLATYESTHGQSIDFDLDAVTDVVEGRSGIRPGWQSMVVYDPATDAFIELGSSIPEAHDLPPEVHDNAGAYAVEIDDSYLQANYLLSADQVRAIRERPAAWTLIRAEIGPGSKPG